MDAYKNDVNQFAAFINAQSLKTGLTATQAQLDSQFLLDYMYHLGEKGYKPATKARKVAATRSFIKFMVARNKLPDTTTKSLVPPRVGKPLPNPLSLSEVRRLLAEPAKSPTPEGKRDRAMLELLYATGMRASELLNLNLEDIDLKTGYICCPSRGSGTRKAKIGRQRVEILTDYIENERPELLHSEETALFLNRRGKRLTRQGLWQIIKQYADRAGLSHKTSPHTLRHTFAAHKIKDGAALQSIQKLLGHAYISSSKVYKEVIPPP